MVLHLLSCTVSTVSFWTSSLHTNVLPGRTAQSCLVSSTHGRAMMITTVTRRGTQNTISSECRFRSPPTLTLLETLGPGALESLREAGGYRPRLLAQWYVRLSISRHQSPTGKTCEFHTCASRFRATRTASLCLLLLQSIPHGCPAVSSQPYICDLYAFLPPWSDCIPVPKHQTNDPYKHRVCTVVALQWNYE